MYVCMYLCICVMYVYIYIYKYTCVSIPIIGCLLAPEFFGNNFHG